jgi:phosphoribosyl 1,2-cyclic phosphodiesterase
MLRFKNLGSGSTGNATLIEARDDVSVSRLLVDCGLGVRNLEARLAEAGLQPADVDAIFITHEHSDHIGCARQWAPRHGIPVWMSHGTHAALGSPDIGGLVRTAHDGVAFELAAMHVTPFTVPHDAREPLQLRCSDGARHLGILTDLGHATAHVLEQLALCDALLLECNHDLDMLQTGNYPWFLKKRVAGDHGHLSNASAAEIAAHLCHDGLRHVVAAHLSQQNNRPELATAALSAALACSPDDILVAHPQEGTVWLDA